MEERLRALVGFRAQRLDFAAVVGRCRLTL